MLASLRLVWAERRGYLGTRFCRNTVQPNHHDMPAGVAHQTQVALWHAGGASPRKAVQDLALPVSRRCDGLSPRWRACAPDDFRAQRVRSCTRLLAKPNVRERPG